MDLIKAARAAAELAQDPVRARSAGILKTVSRDITSAMRQSEREISRLTPEDPLLERTADALGSMLASFAAGIAVYSVSQDGPDTANSSSSSLTAAYGADGPYSAANGVHGQATTLYVSLCATAAGVCVRVMQTMAADVAYSADSKAITALVDQLFPFLNTVFASIFNDMDKGERLLFLPAVVTDIVAILGTPRVFGAQRPAHISQAMTHILSVVSMLDNRRAMDAIKRCTTTLLATSRAIGETVRMHGHLLTTPSESIYRKSYISYLYFAAQFLSLCNVRIVTDIHLLSGMEKYLRVQRYDKSTQMEGTEVSSGSVIILDDEDETGAVNTNKRGQPKINHGHVLYDEENDMDADGNPYQCSDTQAAESLNLLSMVYSTMGVALSVLSSGHLKYCDSKCTTDRDIKWIYKYGIPVNVLIRNAFKTFEFKYLIALKMRGQFATAYMSGLASKNGMNETEIPGAHLPLLTMSGLLDGFMFADLMDFNSVLMPCPNGSMFDFAFKSLEQLDWSCIVLGDLKKAGTFSDTFNIFANVLIQQLIQTPNIAQCESYRILIEREIMDMSLKSITQVSNFLTLKVYSEVLLTSGVGRCPLLLTLLSGTTYLGPQSQVGGSIMNCLRELVSFINMTDSRGLLTSQQEFDFHDYFFVSLINSVSGPHTVNLIKILETYFVVLFHFIEAVQGSKSSEDEMAYRTVQLFMEVGLISSKLADALANMTPSQYKSFINCPEPSPASTMSGVCLFLDDILHGGEEGVEIAISTGVERYVEGTFSANASIQLLAFQVARLSDDRENSRNLLQSIVYNMKRIPSASQLHLLEPSLGLFLSILNDPSITHDSAEMEILENVTLIILSVISSLQSNERLAEITLSLDIFENYDNHIEGSGGSFPGKLCTWKIFTQGSQYLKNANSRSNKKLHKILPVIDEYQFEGLNIMFNDISTANKSVCPPSIERILKSFNGKNIESFESHETADSENIMVNKFGDVYMPPSDGLGSRIFTDIWRQFSTSQLDINNNNGTVSAQQLLTLSKDITSGPL